MPKKIATRRTTKKAGSAMKYPGGLHPVFGPVADPAPWFGPHVDPAPPLIPGGWHGSLVSLVNRETLDADSTRQLTALRVQRLHAAIAALEQQSKILESEWAVLSKRPNNLRLDRFTLPHLPDPGDPVPEIKPVDVIHYIYETRLAVLTRTIAFLKDSLTAIEGKR